MAQIFPKWVNQAPLMLIAGGGVSALFAVAFVWYFFSPRYTDVGYQPHQPVPYSHALHVGELGMDCRYCHAQVQKAAVASVPPTSVCMNCHTIVKRDSELLAPVLASASSDRPMRWVRVHKVPEYAYFAHNVHVNAGVGCSSCHGDIASMEEVRQVEPLSMGWCLDCHRNPAPHIREMDEITDTKWIPPLDQDEAGPRLILERGLNPPTDCSACHR